MDLRLSKPLVLEPAVEAAPAVGDKPAIEARPEKMLSVISLNLGDLTGADLQICVHEAEHQKGEKVRQLATDLDFHLQVIVRASGLNLKTLRRLSAPDFVEVVTAVQGFLTGTVSA